MYHWVSAIYAAMDRFMTMLNRLIGTAVVAGMLFAAIAVPLTVLLEKPEAYLQLQGFQINYFELGHREAGTTDPEWDGAAAGANTGYALAKGIPFVGVVLGPVLGGVLGYMLDDKI